METWERLLHWTRGAAFRVERVRLVDENVAVEGNFELPPLARLRSEDQVFVAAFIRAHGSLKQMEESFGISYPTIKKRLERLSADLDFLNIQVVRDTPPPATTAKDGVGNLLDKLEAGELDINKVLERLETASGARRAR
jgi:hypothetical protein